MLLESLKPLNFETCCLRQRFCFRLLRLVRVLVTLINFQLAIHVRAQLRFGQHALDSGFNHQFRLPSKALAIIFRAQTARISGVVVISLLLGLHAGHLYPLGVDDDHMIAGV